MTGASRSGFEIKSAFQAFYFVIFGFAVVSVINALVDGKNPAVEQLRSMLPASEFVRALPWLTLLYWGFFLTFAVHLLRIYLTLELMEEEQGKFENFYDDYGPVKRFVDFLARVFIVGILTFKVIYVRTFDGFLYFALYFYVALVAWGLFACLFGKKEFRGQSFLQSSLSGLVAALLLVLAGDYWVILNFLAAIATTLLAVDLLFSRNQVFQYIGMFWKKWANKW